MCLSGRPKSNRGQFVGCSPLHASNVGMIRNLNTGYVSPQFHVMYENFFEMVHSDEGSPPSAKVWEQLYIFNCSQVDWDIEPPDLAVEWLMPGERHSRREQNLNGHIEEMVPLGPPLQREEDQAPATIQPAEAPIMEVAGSPRNPSSLRSTRGMAPQRMTYEVKGKPTAYFLAECFQSMIKGLVTCVNQREHQQREFLAMMSSTDGKIENSPRLL